MQSSWHLGAVRNFNFQGELGRKRRRRFCTNAVHASGKVTKDFLLAAKWSFN